LYFRLRDHCKLVEGAARGAIYDLKTGKVHSINGHAAKLLRLCENQDLENLVPHDSPHNNAYDFFDKLVTLELADYYYHEPQQSVPPKISPVKLEFLWLELTSACNNQCLHCYATSGPTCERQQVPHEIWLKVMKEAFQAGARAIQFIGGEPLLYPKWRELIVAAHELGYEYIEIFSNATLITTDDILFFKEYHVQIATTIYADNAAVHDAVTQHPGSFDLTRTAIERILNAAIPLRIASIIMKTNENEVENIMNFCHKLGVEVNPPDVIRPTGRGADEKLKPDHYKKALIQPPFYTDSFSFFEAQHYHNCLAGKLAITATGDVIPCIFSRNQLCGNVLEKSLLTILQEKPLNDYWKTTKDCITKCKNCEYRYACHDCRPLSQNCDSQKSWLACSTGCYYHPETGIWEEK
jgi:radical SAM protein with 4Fe4S-binding SPASM domain